MFELIDNVPSNAVIKVIGVGGGGSNAVNHMFRKGIKDVNFVVCNTDAQALLSSPDNQVQGFLAAGHVCAIMGYWEYEPIADAYGIPIVVTGFEPLDLLQGALDYVNDRYDCADFVLLGIMRIRYQLFSHISHSTLFFYLQLHITPSQDIPSNPKCLHFDLHRINLVDPL